MLLVYERIRAIGENSNFGGEIGENVWHYEMSGVNSNSPDTDIVPSFYAGTRNEGSGENSSLYQAGANIRLTGKRSD